MKILGENSTVDYTLNFLKNEKVLTKAASFISNELGSYKKGFFHGLMAGGIVSSVIWIILMIVILLIR